MAAEDVGAAVVEWDIKRDRVRHLIGGENRRTDGLDRRRTFADIVAGVHPDDRALFRERIQAALDDPRGLYRARFRVITRDGDIHRFADEGRVERDAGGEPRVVVTDKLRSYIKPVRDMAPNADHRAHKGLNNRIEGSHRPTRKREKIMGRFKSPRQAQRFRSAHDQIGTVFRPGRYRLSAKSFRDARADAFRLRDDYAAEMTA